MTMLPRLLPSRVPAVILDPIVRVLIALRITPNVITVVGFLGAVAAAALIATGELRSAGSAGPRAGALDLLDGALARATGRAGPVGALLDSTLDRASEAAVLFGVLLYQLDRGNNEEAALVFVALAGSFLVSYVRTRAGELGSEVAEGLATRPERVLVLGVGLLTGWVRVALWILAIATALTAIQRLVLAIGALRRAQSTEGGD
ncbi:MAG: CDP-alcohol phosphatidyltransferase family protein [Chloroflexi bacterium]|nr:CDP-alcohol phosphatidyltransferase family protein [Chloroflexota bacterium]